MLARREYSQTSSAIRKRRSRAALRRDRQVFHIILSRRLVLDAVRRRQGLPPGARLSKRTLQRVLAEGFEWWCGVWKLLDDRSQK
jgi:hypothetical protein